MGLYESTVMDTVEKKVPWCCIALMVVAGGPPLRTAARSGDLLATFALLASRCFMK